LLLPQYTAAGSEGFAAGATAAVTFLACVVVAFVLAIIMLVTTLRHRATLSGGARVAGFLPLPLLFAGAIVFVAMIRQKQKDRPQDQPPPATTTPATTTVP
jgi:hypothetical protein